MRITAPKLNTSIAKVREFIDKASSAPTLAESAYFMKLARRASKRGS